MRKLQIILAGIPCVVLGLSPAPAHASAARTFVSGQGSDGNPCSLAAPCRTLQVAINNTNAGGEVVILNAAGFGLANITKAITISSMGVEGAVTTTTGQTGITVAAGSGDAVTLRGLTLIGGGVGATGIQINSGKQVLIKGCSITGFTGDGVNFVAGGTSANLIIDGLTVSNNGGNGVTFAPRTTNFGGAHLIGVLAIKNTIGISIDGEFATGNVGAVIGSDNAVNNTTGFKISSISAGAATVGMVTASRSDTNDTGLIADGNSTTYVDRTQITSNQLGWEVTGSSPAGTLISYKNNQVLGNLTDAGASTPTTTLATNQ